MEKTLAVFEKVGECSDGEVVAGNTHGSLEDTDGKGLTAIAEVFHITGFGDEEFLFWIFAVGTNQTIEVFLHLLEVALTVPQGVIRIERYNFDWQSGHIPLIIRLADFFS
jgi:hypothetical protein